MSVGVGVCARRYVSKSREWICLLLLLRWLPDKKKMIRPAMNVNSFSASSPRIELPLRLHRRHPSRLPVFWLLARVSLRLLVHEVLLLRHRLSRPPGCKWIALLVPGLVETISSLWLLLHCRRPRRWGIIQSQDLSFASIHRRSGRSSRSSRLRNRCRNVRGAQAAHESSKNVIDRLYFRSSR